MAVTIPSAFPVLTDEDLIGRIDAGREPLETILEQCNWLYARHQPPAVAFAPYDRGTSYRNTYVVPIMPSADGLVYQFTVGYYTTTGTWDLDIGHSVTATGAVTALISTSQTQAAADYWLTTNTSPNTIPSTARYLRITLEHDSSADDIQLHYFCARPLTVISIPAGTLPSGFTRFDDALLAATGGPIYVELLNRARDNALAVIRDRYQCLASFVYNTSGGRFTTGANSSQLLFRLPYYLPGQHRPIVNVRMWGRAGAGSAGHVIVGQVFGATTDPMSCNSAISHVEPLQLQGEKGELYAVMSTTSGTNNTVYFCTVDWRPGD